MNEHKRPQKAMIAARVIQSFVNEELRFLREPLAINQPGHCHNGYPDTETTPMRHIDASYFPKRAISKIITALILYDSLYSDTFNALLMCYRHNTRSVLAANYRYISLYVIMRAAVILIFMYVLRCLI